MPQESSSQSSNLQHCDNASQTPITSQRGMGDLSGPTAQRRSISKLARYLTPKDTLLSIHDLTYTLQLRKLANLSKSNHTKQITREKQLCGQITSGRQKRLSPGTGFLTMSSLGPRQRQLFVLMICPIFRKNRFGSHFCPFEIRH